MILTSGIILLRSCLETELIALTIVRRVEPCLESYCRCEKDVEVEVLEEGNSWTANREQRTAKQQKGVKHLFPKVNAIMGREKFTVGDWGVGWGWAYNKP